MTNTVYDLPEVCCFHFLNPFSFVFVVLRSLCRAIWHFSLSLLLSRRQANPCAEILLQFRKENYCYMEDKTKPQCLFRHSFIPTEYCYRKFRFRYNIPSVPLEWDKEKVVGSFQLVVQHRTGCFWISQHLLSINIMLNIKQWKLR